MPGAHNDNHPGASCLEQHTVTTTPELPASNSRDRGATKAPQPSPKFVLDPKCGNNKLHRNTPPHLLSTTQTDAGEHQGASVENPHL